VEGVEDVGGVEVDMARGRMLKIRQVRMSKHHNPRVPNPRRRNTKIGNGWIPGKTTGRNGTLRLGLLMHRMLTTMLGLIPNKALHRSPRSTKQKRQLKQKQLDMMMARWQQTRAASSPNPPSVRD